MTGWIKIFESENTIKVELAKAYLVDEHQIEVVVLNKQASSYNNLFGLSELYVHVSKAVLAKFLLENEGRISDVLN
ncbi:hypothetical protein SAMN04515674_12241 [Pseudarcicella hirudinis]|uniref:Signal transducing protein n=1 Tax=Pseudarcicella hirudinis TaxID=1079859 RepID=A0A1I5YWY0_9BACT|nr:hypothetical protein [Pseudarcicella hirudinis]SFQ48724.1 hypothetical protein SAMN04515674_12241 [Pseudarcicella hirudinis]